MTALHTTNTTQYTTYLSPHLHLPWEGGEHASQPTTATFSFLEATMQPSIMGMSEREPQCQHNIYSIIYVHTIS